MRLAGQLLLMMVMGLMLGACSDPDPATRSVDYIEKGDLDDMEDHGVVRLLAPRLDEDPALPREGLPLSDYRDAAESFVRVLGLEPRWVPVERFADLIPALEQGRGDMIVTNMSNTESRAERVGFSVPVKIVNEVLILPSSRPDVDLETVSSLTIAVPKGTAYEETVRKLMLDNPNISLELIDGAVADTEMVDGVAAGTWEATIMDQDLAEILVSQAVGVNMGPVVEEDREIAWATRQDNTELRRRLNEFLIATSVAGSRQDRVLRSWNEIRQSGVLRVITSNSPASYFLWRGDLMGFDYELMNHFAEQHDLRLAVVVRNEPEAMHEALMQGRGDVIAASMTKTDERQENGWVFSRRYLSVTEQVLARTNQSELSSVEDLNGKTVAVNPQHSFMTTLLELQDQGIKVTIDPVPGTTTELLVQGLAEGKYDYVMADSHMASLETTLRDDVHVVLDLGDEQEIGWVVRPDQKGLRSALNSYIGKEYRGLHFNVLFNRYFEEERTISEYDEFRVEAGKDISPYDEMVRELTVDTDFDWRLLIAQIFQESRFDPKARSFAGAVGLMQVLPRTAAQFGYDGNLEDPETNIQAGLAFLEWLEERFPARLPLEQRVFFSLAAYNAGHGHVHDARRLARQLGKDPDQWFGHTEEAMLLLSRPEYARKARYGYVRGSEPVQYVRKIRERYLGYLQTGGGEQE